MLELLEQLFRHVRAYMQSERFNRHQVHSQSADHRRFQQVRRRLTVSLLIL